ncbi:MAG TPA: hypothetical protein VND99_00655 [Candidatus Acidoferrales bacterium]|nr:hypothetical protein [Candidatus Acidoferrales bacterium]
MLNVSSSVLFGASIFGMAYFILITLVELTLGTWIVLSWANEEWEIKEGVIYHRRGILSQADWLNDIKSRLAR